MAQSDFDRLLSGAIAGYPEEAATELRGYAPEELVPLFVCPGDVDEGEERRLLTGLARLFTALSPAQQPRLLARLEPALIARILVAGRGPEVRAIVNQLDARQRAAVLEGRTGGERKRLEALFAAQPGTASSFMGNDYVRVMAEESAEQVMTRLRELDGGEEMPIYCVDRSGALVGAIAPLGLVSSAPGRRMTELARNVMAVGDLTPLELLRQPSLWGEQRELPVVGRNNRLVGVIRRQSVEIDDADAGASLGASLIGLFDDYVKVSSELTTLTLGGRR